MALDHIGIDESKKRILVIMPDYRFGGAEKQLLMIIHALETAGKCADVYVLNHNMSDHSSGEIDNEFDQMKYVRFISLQMNGYSRWETKWCLFNYLCANDLCSAYSVAILFYSWLLPMVPVFKSMGIRVLYSERVSAEEIYTDGELQKLARQCDVITSNSAVAAQRIEDSIQQKVLFIRNGRDEVKRITSKRPDSITRILVPAAIDTRKNQLLVLRFINENKDKDYVCRFVGRISDRNYLAQIKACISENGLDEKAQIMGFTEDMQSQYEWADIVILPSFSEGTPNVVLEAFSYGKPIIVSDIPEERDLVKDAGLRFSPGNCDEINTCIRYIEGMTDDEYENMLAKNAAYVSENYSISVMTDSYLSLISELEEPKGDIQTKAWLTDYAEDIVKLC